jgi:DNA-binding transcriptional ArsR family regulator
VLPERAAAGGSKLEHKFGGGGGGGAAPANGTGPRGRANRNLNHLHCVTRTGAYVNFTPGVNPQEDAPATVKPWEWKGLLRRARLDFATKAIGRAIADYADKDTGEDIFPGVAHLSVDTGASPSTVKRALAVLRKLGLIRMTKRGNRRRGLADEYALAIPEDGEERGLVVLTPDEYKAAVVAAAAVERHVPGSQVTVTCDEPDHRSEGPVIEPITGHCDPPPTSNPYLPTKSDHPDELALPPELPTAREETPVNPEEIDEMQRQGVPGPERARRALAAANRPFERKGVVDLPAPPLPPVPADNGLAVLRRAAEEWGNVEVEYHLSE